MMQARWQHLRIATPHLRRARVSTQPLRSSDAHARCVYHMWRPAVLRPASHETGVKLPDSATNEAAKSHLNCINSACDVGCVVVDQECCFVIVAEGTSHSAGHTTAWGGVGSVDLRSAHGPILLLRQSRASETPARQFDSKRVEKHSSRDHLDHVSKRARCISQVALFQSKCALVSCLLQARSPSTLEIGARSASCLSHSSPRICHN